MLLKKSAQQILRDAAIYIAENTPITNFSAGSIARSIVEAMAPEIGTGTDTERVSLYDFAQEVLDQGFLSKATNEQLDLIGGLFSYPRRVEQVRGEDGNLTDTPLSDESYRYELSQVVPAMATGNYAALRLALLSIQGVQDIIGKEYTHGTGSFSFVLIPQFGFDEQEVIRQMQETIDNTKGYGIRPNIITTVKVPVDITLKLIFHETTVESEKTAIRSTAQTRLTDYFGNFEMGQGFTYNDMVQEAMNSHEKIIDFEITKFYLNNEPVLLTNHEILEDEQIIPQNIQVI